MQADSRPETQIKTARLSAQAGGRVVVLGEALLDIFPTRTVVGGAPFNVACSLAALGVDVCLITRLGADANGDLVRLEAKRLGLGVAGVQTDLARPTGSVKVTITAHENHFAIAEDQAWDYLDETSALAALAAVPAQVVTQSGSYNYLYFGTLAQRSAQSRETILHLANQFSGHVYLDLNLREMPDIRTICERSLKLADTVKVNEEELRQLFAWFGDARAVAASWRTALFTEAVAALMQAFALHGLIVTRGAEGYAYFDENGALLVEGNAVANVMVADTVGAGDSFSAMFLGCQAHGVTIDESLSRASELAAAICGIHGAVPSSSAFYARWLLGNANADSVNS